MARGELANKVERALKVGYGGCGVGGALRRRAVGPGLFFVVVRAGFGAVQAMARLVQEAAAGVLPFREVALRELEHGVWADLR